MRNKHQLEVRARRVALANEILLWLKKENITGGRDVYPTLGLFQESLRKDLGAFQTWKAWDILRETKRVSSKPGGWKVLDFTPIVEAGADG